MIIKISVNELKENLYLQSDFAGENPIYILLEKKELFYSENIVELLNKKKLNISNIGLSFLLKSGVVPQPFTIYENFYILSIGDKLEISRENGNFKLDFTNDFNFSHKNKKTYNEFNTDEALDLLAEATIQKINKNKNTFLFHSAGKDSNTILLSLYKHNYRDINLLTYKAKGPNDESEISKKIAKQLGYKHIVLSEPEKITNSHLENFIKYFKNIPLPVMDTSTLAYPIYDNQLDLSNSNIIDGMGNDVYMGHIPSINEYRFAHYLSIFSFLKPFTNKINSENYFNIIGLNKIEWTGLIGFMDRDALGIYNEFISPDTFWKKLQNKYIDLNYIDLRAKIRGGIVDQEIFMRKVRNFGDINNSNIIFPWCNKDVAKYFYNLDNKFLFDDKLLKNKLVLRSLLKDKLGLDSDKIGKLGYGFDYWKLLENIFLDVRKNILECNLWNKPGIEKLFIRLSAKSKRKDRYANRAKSLIQRLYLISIWYNNNKYIER